MNRNPSRSLTTTALLLALFLLLTPRTARATEEMRAATAELAEKLQQFLAGKDQKTIVVKEFEEKGTRGAPASGLIKLLLIEELKKRGIDVAVHDISRGEIKRMRQRGQWRFPCSPSRSKLRVG